ncbi:hypothetical protein [Microcoleus sp. D2_18a_B4]|uniref:hypothetical protein n=1 Tax=Microcoleus sp. D2_18a_B4 TaxID=3055329 RepID=UPI002FD560FD
MEQAVGPVLENARRARQPTRYFIHLAPLIVNQAVRGGRDAPQEHLTFVEQAGKPVKRDLCMISERQIFLRFAIETLNYN